MGLVRLVLYVASGLLYAALLSSPHPPILPVCSPPPSSVPRAPLPHPPCVQPASIQRASRVEFYRSSLGCGAKGPAKDSTGLKGRIVELFVSLHNLKGQGGKGSRCGNGRVRGAGGVGVRGRGRAGALLCPVCECTNVSRSILRASLISSSPRTLLLSLFPFTLLRLFLLPPSRITLRSTRRASARSSRSTTRWDPG